MNFFQYEIFDLAKRSQNQLQSKSLFGTFLLLSFSNFRLKLYEKP